MSASWPHRWQLSEFKMIKYSQWDVLRLIPSLSFSCFYVSQWFRAFLVLSNDGSCRKLWKLTSVSLVCLCWTSSKMIDTLNYLYKINALYYEYDMEKNKKHPKILFQYFLRIFQSLWRLSFLLCSYLMTCNLTFLSQKTISVFDFDKTALPVDVMWVFFRVWLLCSEFRTDRQIEAAIHSQLLTKSTARQTMLTQMSLHDLKRLSYLFHALI